MKTVVDKCSYCKHDLTDGEIEYPFPQDAGPGDQICESCRREHYTYDCDACGNMEDDEHQHNMLVVFTPTSGGRYETVKPGVYEIIGSPYFGGPIIGELRLFPAALKRVCGLPRWLSGRDRDHPCGHLYLRCQERARQ